MKMACKNFLQYYNKKKLNIKYYLIDIVNIFIYQKTKKFISELVMSKNIKNKNVKVQIIFIYIKISE